MLHAAGATKREARLDAILRDAVQVRLAVHNGSFGAAHSVENDAAVSMYQCGRHKRAFRLVGHAHLAVERVDVRVLVEVGCVPEAHACA